MAASDKPGWSADQRAAWLRDQQLAFDVQLMEIRKILGDSLIDALRQSAKHNSGSVGLDHFLTFAQVFEILSRSRSRQ